MVIMPKIVDHSEQKRAIASAAIAVIGDVGMETTRLRDIAARASVTTGAITHYFDSRDAVLAAALEEIVRRNLDRGIHSHPELRTSDDIIEFAAGFLPINAERRGEWRVWCAYWGRAIASEALRETHRAYYKEIGATLSGLLRELAGSAQTGVDFRAVSDAIVAAIDGLGVRVTMEPDDWPAKRQKAVLRMMLEPLLVSLPLVPDAAKTRRRNHA